jgi:hypothetical protein
MKTANLLFLLVAVLLIVGVSFGSDDSQGLTLMCGELDGTNYCQAIGPLDLLEVSKWNPNIEECPLGARDAVMAARACLSERFPFAEAWIVTSVDLNSLRDGGAWYYVIWFWPSGSSTRAPNGLQMMVLLNSRVPKLMPMVIDIRRQKKSESSWDIMISPKAFNTNKAADEATRE